MLTDNICIKNGVVVDVDVHVDLTLDKFYRKFEDELRAKALNRIGSFFALNNWDYGKVLKNVDLIKSLSDMIEIQSIEIHFQTDDEENSGDVVTTQFFEIIRPNTIDINFIYE
jgi:hypothetical protein